MHIKTGKRLMSLTLAITMTLTLCPIFTPMASAASSGTTIDVDDSTTASGTGWTYAGGVFTVTGDVTITSSARYVSSVSNRIVVPPGVNVNILLHDVNIASTGCAFEIQGDARVTLTLYYFNYLTSSGTGRAGLEVSDHAKLTITETEPGAGALVVTSGSGGAGIGGGTGGSGGAITINGGYISASSGGFIANGAGIGGGAAGNGGIITINGGDIRATGNRSGAGIGGGIGGSGGTITINGGNITATSVYGAGIGGGDGSTNDGGDGGDIVINSGVVNAKGGNGANDIGSGDGGNPGVTWITGGSVFAANGLINGFTSPLYPVKVTVKDGDTEIDSAIVTSGSYIAETGGNLTDIFTSGTYGKGVAWLWLPAGEIFLVADDGTSKAGVLNQTIETTGNNDSAITLEPYTYVLDWDDTSDSFADLEYGYSIGSSATYTVKNNGNKQIIGINAAITAGSDNFEVESGYDMSFAVGATMDITVTSVTGKNATNGTPYTGTLTITWRDGDGATGITQTLSQTVSKAAPTTLTPPTASAITYGAMLSTSELTGGSAGGTWEWTESETIPSIANDGYQVTFTPVDMDNYNWDATIKTYTVDITVNKAAGNFVPTDPIDTIYTTTLTLADLSLPTGYVWDAPSTPLSAGDNQSFAATYTDPDGNYEPANGNIKVNVAKAAGSFETVTPLDTTYTTTLKLSDLSLPSGYAWDAPNTALNAGYGQTFAATFTDLGGNYEAATGTVTVNVAKAAYIGTATATDCVLANQTTTGKTVTLPPLPAGASYGTVTPSGTLIDGTPTVSGATLTYNTTSQSNGTSATVTIAVTGATNYNEYDVVVTVTATEYEVTFTQNSATDAMVTFNAPAGAAVIIAFYKDNTLLNVDIRTVTQKGTGKFEDVIVNQTADTVKVMLWKDLATIIPLCASETKVNDNGTWKKPN